MCASPVAPPVRLISAMSAGHAVAAVPGAPPLKRLRGKTSPLYSSLLEAVGGENGEARQQVYLITISRVLPGMAAAAGYKDIAALTRAEVMTAIRDSLDNPVSSGPGRPRSSTESPIELAVVVREAHADGSPHFHAVVKLRAYMRFKQSKRTMAERHKLPSHWLALD